MNNYENMILKVSTINKNYESVASFQYEQDLYSREVISKIPIACVENRALKACNLNHTKLHLSYNNFKCEDEHHSIVSLVKVENNKNASFDTIEDSLEKRSLVDSGGSILKFKFLNIPTMIRCQNCETNFPTKYQYQRHQCEFNAEKVVLKPNADLKDINKGMRIKYECSSCGKQFISKNNLERHQASHKNSRENICEHCNKQFVSENRLRIHKENHCKKAGDISKFYRSDVAVWKCNKCHEVFSSLSCANFHVISCKEYVFMYEAKTNNSMELLRQKINDAVSFVADENPSQSNGLAENFYLEKILTEILLQCEFCNRTYADKNLLLLHQKKHSTAKNYECVNCNSVFDSYAVAAQHWLKICSENANLFYLPKLTYCEYCDRTFKSHEILYTHKIKKKHYTLKMHKSNEFGSSNNSFFKEKCTENKDAINKLIEDVLLTLDRPIHKTDQQLVDDDNEKLYNNNKHSSTVNNLSDINEPCEEEADLIISNTFTNLLEKKKRGRKRKWIKQQTTKVKKNNPIYDGCKYQCERCPLVWNDIPDLESHRDREHATNYNCDECGQVLHSAKALLIHSRAHKSLKPYVCDTCGRSYSQTSHLWQHMRFHQGIKPFACPHEGCEARYTIRPDLKDHIRKVHTRERPFKCLVCNKCFLTGSVYYQHRLIHTNDRRYGCDVCHKRFFRADALNNHKRIHTDERPYPCTVCGREFRQKGDRNKHLRTQHPDAILT